MSQEIFGRVCFMLAFAIRPFHPGQIGEQLRFLHHSRYCLIAASQITSPFRGGQFLGRWAFLRLSGLYGGFCARRCFWLLLLFRLFLFCLRNFRNLGDRLIDRFIVFFHLRKGFLLLIVFWFVYSDRRCVSMLQS